MATLKSLPIYAENTISTNNGSFTLGVINYGLVTLQLVLTGITGANFKFEASCDSTDGTDGHWVDLYGVRSNSTDIENMTGALSASPAYTWDFSVANYSFIRVTATSGTFGAALWVARRFPNASEPMPVVQIAGTPSVAATPVTPTKYNLNSAATTNAASVKASAGTVFAVAVSNQNAAVRFLKLYDKASAPTVGTDVPVLTISVPAAGLQVLNFGALGLRFSTGIAIATTTGVEDTDATAVAASDLHINVDYI